MRWAEREAGIGPCKRILPWWRQPCFVRRWAAPASLWPEGSRTSAGTGLRKQEGSSLRGGAEESWQGISQAVSALATAW